MPTSMQVPVSMRALLLRINRKLKKDGEVLKTLRGDRYEQDLGRYYSVNWRTTGLPRRTWIPVALGRELGALAAWEMVEEEEIHGQ